MIDCSIIIASYGAEHWRQLALERAVPTAQAQPARELLVRHDPAGTVASIRNELAREAKGEYLCFVDADDEAGGEYLEGMTAARDGARGTDLLLTPRVSYMDPRRSRRARAPVFWPEIDMRVANWIVIGTLVPRKLFLRVGGFADRPEFGAFEDWEMWIRCLKGGATIVRAPRAIYIAHIERTSRHRSVPASEAQGWHFAIGREHYPELYPDDWAGRSRRVRRRVRT